MRLSPRLPDGDVNVGASSPLRDFVSMLVVIAAGLAAVYALLGLAVDFVAPRISWDTERLIARHMMGAHPMLKQADPAPQWIRDRAEAARLAAGGVPHPVDVRVVDTPMVNAFALPGGHVVLTSGILDAMEFDNELTFILGHELGHVAARDHLRGMGRGLVLVAINALVFEDSGSLGDLAVRMLTLTDRTFSRAQERRADVAGLEAMVAVHGHVGGVEAVFEHLGGRDHGYLAEFALTHPETGERVSDLAALARERGYPERAPAPFPASR